MNERTIWIVRMIGLVIILAMALLMLNLYTQLVRLRQRQEERPAPAPAKSSSAMLRGGLDAIDGAPALREGLNVEC